MKIVDASLSRLVSAISSVLAGEATRLDIPIQMEGGDKYSATVYRLHGSIPARVDLKPIAISR